MGGGVAVDNLLTWMTAYLQDAAQEDLEAFPFEDTRHQVYILWAHYDSNNVSDEAARADELLQELDAAERDVFTCEFCGDDRRSGTHGLQRDVDRWDCIPDEYDNDEAYDRMKGN